MKKAKILSALSAVTAATLLAAGPALALTVEVSGNGADSDNTANVSVNQSTSITQTNNANISNNVNANANTGGNSANNNTGGDTSINTGDASTNVALNNTANSSRTSVGCCDPISAAISISGNGANSDNNISFNINNSRNVTTVNNLNIDNDVNATANTGDNSANGNTGGNTSIKTGDANVNVTIGNSGNSNEAIVCGCLIAGLVNPPTPTVKPIPGVPTVLGLTSTSLPMTGFNYPFQLILGLTALLVGLGFVLKNKASQVEQALNSFGSKLKF